MDKRFENTIREVALKLHETTGKDIIVGETPDGMFEVKIRNSHGVSGARVSTETEVITYINAFLVGWMVSQVEAGLMTEAQANYEHSSPNHHAIDKMDRPEVQEAPNPSEALSYDDFMDGLTKLFAEAEALDDDDDDDDEEDDYS